MKRNYLEVSLILLIIITIFLFNYISALPVSSNAQVSFEISSVGRIFIYSPEAINYSFFGDENLEILLNVSYTGFIPDTWWYNLGNSTDLVNESIVFDPFLYSNISVLEGYNKLEVYSNDSLGNNYSSEVIFNVTVISAPVLQGINSTIYVCEGDKLNYEFNVLNYDFGSLEFSLNPMVPFYVFPISYSGGENNVSATIVSSNLSKDDVRTFENPYLETVFVEDGYYSDFAETSIHVIEINHFPQVENIGVKTFWSRGENSSFYEEVSINDTEEGELLEGTFYINLTWLNGENFFNISDSGIINFTFNSSHLGVYNLSLCVSDSGLDYIHPNISLCGQDGTSLESCQNFSITVTDENRAPNITSYYPNTTNFSAEEGVQTYLNVTTYDPDYTIPDVYWYVDNVLIEYDSGDSFEEFYYTFGYSDAGVHIINVTITDGLLNDTNYWIVNVSNTPLPPVITPEGGGGGGGITSKCTPKWVCGLWSTCNQIDIGIKDKEISEKDSINIKDLCIVNHISPDRCGFQYRNCIDLNNCKISTGKPYETRMCEFFENPNCNDNIKNCHHGSCEILVDCGGPCSPCPTCSDGIKNQGEEGIDCGGPCPWKCLEEKPSFKKLNILYIIFIIIIFLIIITIIKIIKLLRYSRKLKEYRS
jgi:hypothetical protein